jgi:phosphate transport system substrate-binding protein
MHWKSMILALACAACATVQPASEPVRIDGSPGVMPLVKAIAEEYGKSARPAAPSFGTGLGSSARIDSLKAGRIDIALASHGIDVAAMERQGLKVHKIADVPVGFGVHSSVTIASLTEAQVCDIYAGRMTNWRQVGGPDLPIAAATRPKGEVDGDVVTAGIPCVATPHASVVSKALPQDMSAFLAATPGAIGMTTTTVAGQSEGRIRLVSLDGMAPTPENVIAGRYRLTRESFLVTSATSKPGVADFLAFIRSPAGARVITGTGAIPR